MQAQAVVSLSVSLCPCLLCSSVVVTLACSLSLATLALAEPAGEPTVHRRTGARDCLLAAWHWGLHGRCSTCAVLLTLVPV